MRRAVVVGAAVATFGMLCVSAATTARTQTPRLTPPPPSLVQYGYVRSLLRAGETYRLRFDPALWLSGRTASRAAVEDGVIAPGEAVPNDYYIRNESRKQLTYVVLLGARVTVVTNTPTGALGATRIPVSELAAIVAGRNPKSRRLFERTLGYWVRIAGDRVTQLDQQYQP